MGSGLELEMVLKRVRDVQAIGADKEQLDEELRVARKDGAASGQHEVQAAALQKKADESAAEAKTLQQLLNSAAAEVDQLRQMVRFLPADESHSLGQLAMHIEMSMGTRYLSTNISLRALLQTKDDTAGNEALRVRLANAEAVLSKRAEAKSEESHLEAALKQARSLQTRVSPMPGSCNVLHEHWNLFGGSTSTGILS